MTKILPTYPNKRLNYGLFGPTYCDPGVEWGHHWIPTDGTTSSPVRACDGTLGAIDTYDSNQQAYLQTNGWQYELGPSSFELRNPTAQAPGRTAGYTLIEDFVDTYVTLMDDLDAKWWLELSNATSDTSVFTYQTPGYTSSHYFPEPGFETAYELALGPYFDYIEENCNTNFQGYSFEIAHQNFVQWLHDRTAYCVSNKDWSGYQWSTDLDDVNVLLGTDENGDDISATPLERVGLLDELIIELFDANFVTWWTEALPDIVAAYPDLPVVINVDQVCLSEGWSGGAPTEPGTDIGWWAEAGEGEPSNRCATEKAGCIQRVSNMMGVLGKPYAGMVYNFYWSAAPQSGMSRPDVTWFLQWADTNITPFVLTESVPGSSVELFFDIPT